MPHDPVAAALEVTPGPPASPGAVVLRCVAADNSSESLAAVEHLLAAGQPDWDRVLQLAEREAVLPLFARCFQGSLGSLMPDAVHQRLHRLFLERAAAGVALGCELARVLSHFGDRRIAALPFKGPVLATQIYGSRCWRQCDDLDILVAPRHWAQAIQELQSLGYCADPSPNRSAQHELRMVRMDAQGWASVIDLHRALMPSWCGFDPDFDALFSRAETVQLSGTAVSTLCPEDLLLFLSIHAAKHGWAQLKWAADIAGLLRVRPQLDWPTVLAAARGSRSRRRLLVGVAAAARFFEFPLPGSVANAISGDPAAVALSAEISAGPPAALPYWQRIRLMIATRDDWRGRLRVWLLLLRLAARLTDADRSWFTRPARLLRVHGPAISRLLRTIGSPDAAAATRAFEPRRSH